MQGKSNQTMLKRHRKYMFYLLALFVLGWGFTTYKAIFLGLIIGTIVSYYNHWLLYRKVDKFAETVVTGGKMYSLGTISRMAAAALAVLIASRFSDSINIYSTVLGLMTSYIVIFIDILINPTKQNV